MIGRFLREPDKLAKNPQYVTAAPMKLYDLARVERVEKRKTFRAARDEKVAGLAKRKAAAVVAVTTRKANVIRGAESIDIPPFDVLTPEALIVAACPSFPGTARYLIECAATLDLDEDELPPPGSFQEGEDAAYLRRKIVNHLRHARSEYDRHVARLKGKVAQDEAYSVIRCKVLKRIAEAYPWLAEECRRQTR